MSEHGDLFEELEGYPAGTVLEVTTFEGDRFRIEAEGQQWRDWLAVEGHAAPPHLQPNLGTGFGRVPPAYGVRALVEWTNAGYLIDFRVVADAARAARTDGKGRATRKVAGSTTGASR